MLLFSFRRINSLLNHLDDSALHVIREPLGSSNLKEGAIGEWSPRRDRATRRRQEQKPRKRRDGDKPISYSARTALRREQFDVTAERRNSRARAWCPLLSNGPEITFPLQQRATNESLPGNKLLNTRLPWQPTEQQRTINCSTWCFLCGAPSSYEGSRHPEFERLETSPGFVRQMSIRRSSMCELL
jgi:hypothetical protein